MALYWDFFSLFPAYAGVILVGGKLLLIRFTFPRVCGGDPDVVTFEQLGVAFSPRMRG